MKLKAELSQNLPFYFFIVGLFIIAVSPKLLSDGMFLDGITYSAISKNLSNGIGTFWKLHYTATCYPEFHQHPPLAFAMQSFFYSIFGESRFIDKIYSIFTFAVTGFIILQIWKMLNLKHGWIPLLFWFSFPLVGWAVSNNILENTLTIFTSLSVLFYLISQNKKRWLFLFLSGLMLSFGFLTKGFVAFFPWAFPFFMWLFLKQQSCRKMIIDTLGIFIFTVIPLISLVLLSKEAKLSLFNYIDIQVINSIKNEITVTSRFYIIKILLYELIPAFCLSLLLLFVGKKKKFAFNLLKEKRKMALAFILFGLTGVLPIMISLKQSGFYMLATFPFFAIGCGIFIYPFIDLLVRKINYQSKGFLFFKWLGYGLFFTGLVLTLSFSNNICQDKNKIKDSTLILSKLPEGSIVSIHPDMYENWFLHAYFARYKNVSLDPNPELQREYLLIEDRYYSDKILQNYTIIKIPTTDYYTKGTQVNNSFCF